MEDIEVVIKIPKILYAQIQSDAEIMIYSGMRSWKGILATLLRSVRNGTPLPKGHGRLIDAEAFQKSYCESNCGNRKCVDAMDECIFIGDLQLAPTIIEADMED